jgi:dihydroorotase
MSNQQSSLRKSVTAYKREEEFSNEGPILDKKITPDLKVIREHSEEIQSKKFIKKSNFNGAKTLEVKNLRQLKDRSSIGKKM